MKARHGKAKEAIERDDFRQAPVKKRTGASDRKFYCTKLDHTNHLLFSLLRYGGHTYAPMQ